MRPATGILVLAIAFAVGVPGCAPARPPTADIDSYLKARDFYLRGAVDQADSLVSRIDSRTRSFHQARLLEGKILFFKSRMPDAERIFRELTSRLRGYTEAELWLLRTLQAQGKTAEAGKRLDTDLEMNPGDPRFLHLAGMLRLGTNDIDGALGFFRRSEEYAPELAQSYVESARILYRFGLVDPALADLASAQALLPADSDMRKPVEELARRVREARK
jgi:tetratricopeptide (TPR) repeat protein